MMKNLLLLTLLVSTSFLSCRNQNHNDPVKKEQLEQSITRGFDWLLNQQFYRRDVITFNQWLIEELTDDTSPLAEQLRSMSMSVYNSKYSNDLLLRKLIGDKSDLPLTNAELEKEQDHLNYKLKTNTLGNSKGGTQDYLMISLYADDPRIPPLFKEIFKHQFTASLTRYGTTHQMLGCIFLRRARAFPKKKIDAAINRLASRISGDAEKIQLKGEFTDLFAEQIAMLCMSDSFQQIKRDWILFIIDSQQDDGGWKQSINESNYFKPDMDQHATVLALYSLLTYYNYHYPNLQNHSHIKKVLQ